jgi:hypothetical protein
MVPILICLPSIGRTLSRGQINLIVLMLFCLMAAFVFARRNWLAGFVLSLAISIKLFPAYMLVYPLWRRNWPAIFGCIGGLILSLIIVPAIFMGPTRAAQSYQHFYGVFLGPAFAGGGDGSRSDEILATNGTDSQAFSIVIDNTLAYFSGDPKRALELRPWERAVHWSLVALCTATTLICGRRKNCPGPIEELLFLGALLVVMIPSSPISHTHYFVFALPLVMAMCANAWRSHGFPHLGVPCAWLFTIHIVANVLSMLPGLAPLKYMGLSLYGTLILWVAALAILYRRHDPAPVT